jgi:hypothetical protein
VAGLPSRHWRICPIPGTHLARLASRHPQFVRACLHRPQAQVTVGGFATQPQEEDLLARKLLGRRRAQEVNARKVRTYILSTEQFAPPAPTIGPAMRRLHQFVAETRVPCQADPDAWSSIEVDVQAEAARQCLDACPLLTECRAALDEHQPGFSAVVAAGVWCGAGRYRGPRKPRPPGSLPIDAATRDRQRERANDEVRKVQAQYRAARASARRNDAALARAERAKAASARAAEAASGVPYPNGARRKPGTQPKGEYARAARTSAPTTSSAAPLASDQRDSDTQHDTTHKSPQRRRT